VNLSKTFDLNAAGKRSQAVCQQIERQRDKSDTEQDNGFDQYRNLPPVKHFDGFHAENISQHDPDRKGKDRAEIGQCGLKISFGKVDSKKEHIAGLGIGKHMSSHNI